MGLKNCGPLPNSSSSIKKNDPMKGGGSGLTMYIVELKESEKNKPKSERNKSSTKKK
jgi:hypothetical protein